MNTKRNSTISTKPGIDPALHWIGGAAAEAPTPAPAPVEIDASLQANKQTSQQDDTSAIRRTSKQGDKFVLPEPELTQMLSVRIPAALIRKLRIRAVTEGRPIQEIVIERLRDYLDED